MDDLAMTQCMKSYVANSNEAIEFKLIRTVEDLESNDIIFKPSMSHQVFGNSEAIFGYRDLKVKLYYSAGCLETYLGITYEEMLNKCDVQKIRPDNVLSMISAKLAPDTHYSYDKFVESLEKDDKFVPYGELIHSFEVNDNGSTRQFVVYKADMNYKGFKDYHRRLETFILWYIDAANFIDIDDEQWQSFNMFEKYTTTMGTTRYATIGYATVYQYYAYPHHIRPRIAQILILPPFQRIGLGTHLLKAIYREYVGRNEVKDITVEDPSVTFQRIRDYIDAINCLTLPTFNRECLIDGFNKAMIVEARDKFKINKKQARRVYEILRLRATNVANEEEYRVYRLDVKRRLNIPFRKEENEIRKLEWAMKNVDKRSNLTVLDPEQRKQILEKEYRTLEEEYKLVVKRLEDTPEL